MTTWNTLSAAQKDFYMEFHAPTINNVRREPDTHDIILPVCSTPSQLHINSVTDTGDQLVRTLNHSLTAGQRNAILDFIREMDEN